MSETSSIKSDSNNNNLETNNESANVEIGYRQKLYSLLVKVGNLEVPTNDDLQEHEHVLKSVLDDANIDFESSIYSARTTLMLVRLLNYSNKTVLVPCLIKTDYPRALLKWLSSVSK
jgi:hypothetical protein